MKREKVYVIDENDNVIGEKWRDELTDNDCWRVVSIWVVDEAGNILLQQRSFLKKLDPGDWSAAAEGTVEAGDSYDETALRELEEEIGVLGITLTPTKKIQHKMASLGSRIRQGYIAVIPHKDASEFTIQKEEVEQVRWFTPDEFIEFCKKAEQISLLPIYQELGFIS